MPCQENARTFLSPPGYSAKTLKLPSCTPSAKPHINPSSPSHLFFLLYTSFNPNQVEPSLVASAGATNAPQITRIWCPRWKWALRDCLEASHRAWVVGRAASTSLGGLLGLRPPGTRWLRSLACTLQARLLSRYYGRQRQAKKKSKKMGEKNPPKEANQSLSLAW